MSEARVARLSFGSHVNCRMMNYLTNEIWEKIVNKLFMIEAMARDPRNIFQDNPKQLEKKIRIYKQTSYYKAIECAEDQ